MTTLTCPKCREENPADADLCWACYTPLGENAKRVAAINNTAVAKPQSALEKVGRRVSEVAPPYVGLAGVFAHSWLPRALRWLVLSASLSVLGGPFLLDKRRERASRGEGPIDAAEMATDGPAETPTERIASTILLYAVKEKVTRIRIEKHGRGVDVFYQIEGEWHEQMKMPLYVWTPLRQKLLDYARQGGLDSVTPNYLKTFEFASRIKAMSAHLEVGARGEKLRLEFESALPEAMELPFANVPEVYCRACNEANAPGSVWCWSCGAVTRQVQAVPEEIDHRVLQALFFGALGMMASSGWLSRPMRLPVAGAGLLGAAAPLAVGTWSERRSSHEIHRLRESAAAADKPVLELSESIVADGLKRNASAIRLQEHGNVMVSHQVGEAWHQSAVLPVGTWLALRNQLLKMARENQGLDDKKRAINAELSSNVGGETLILRFDEEA